MDFKQFLTEAVLNPSDYKRRWTKTKKFFKRPYAYLGYPPGQPNSARYFSHGKLHRGYAVASIWSNFCGPCKHEAPFITKVVNQLNLPFYNGYAIAGKDSWMDEVQDKHGLECKKAKIDPESSQNFCFIYSFLQGNLQKDVFKGVNNQIRIVDSNGEFLTLDFKVPTNLVIKNGKVVGYAGGFKNEEEYVKWLASCGVPGAKNLLKKPEPKAASDKSYTDKSGTLLRSTIPSNHALLKYGYNNQYFQFSSPKYGVMVFMKKSISADELERLLKSKEFPAIFYFVRKYNLINKELRLKVDYSFNKKVNPNSEGDVVIAVTSK